MRHYRHTHVVDDNTLLQANGSDAIPLGSPAWYAWLNDDQTTSFVYRSARGGFTARRERQRNGWYWYAYRRIGGRLRKRYLGRAGDLTAERLRRVDMAFINDETPTQAPYHSSDQALTTANRLRPPPLRPSLIARPRLIERIDDTLHAALTLISAPAGFGKTTLLTEWALHVQSAARAAVAWISLDATDDDPVRFWSAITLALSVVRTDIGAHARSLLESPQRPPHMLLAHALLVDLNAVAAPIIVVLDDYHLITSAEVHESLTTFIEHLSPHVHLVIATRADPPLPLARWRVRGRLAELRAADLRFTTEEAAAFLRSTMGLDLPLDVIRALEDRTEGWVAALQLAALSIRDRADVEGFIRRFAGSHRAIVDYLAEEVIGRQPDHIQTFLLRTSIVDRMSAELCDALLTPAADEPGAAIPAQAMLDHLERANLFVTPLDEERRWYRYHHLFAEMLRDRLQRTQPALVAELHRRAARWHREAGFADAAINHFLQAGDAANATDVIEAIADATLWEQGDAQTLLRWIAALPDDTVLARPRLALDQVWALLASIQFDAAEARAAELDHVLTRRDAQMRSVVIGELAAVRSVAARVRGDVPRALEYATHARDHLASIDCSLARAIAVMNLVEAHLMQGNLSSAEQLCDELRIASLSRNLVIALIGVLSRSEVYRNQGRLTDACALLDEALRLLERRGASERPIVALIHLALADILYEHNRLDEAEYYANLALRRAERWWNNDILIHSTGLLSAIRRAQGDEAAAAKLAERVEQLSFEYRVGWISNHTLAGRAERLLRTGDRQAAERWAAGCGLTLADDPPPERFYEYLVLARVALARGEGRTALPLIRRLLKQSEEGRHTIRMIETLKLLALTNRQIGDAASARQALIHALRLAEPGGLVRTFVDEGEAMKWLLADCGASIAPQAQQGDGDARRLLAYVDDLMGMFRSIPTTQTASPFFHANEPLTAREIQVLRLLATGHTDQEIATSLVIAVSTVRSHIKRIYAKINARNRTQAAARARDLGIIA
ncbi:LuxR C-terminal-related transcriptional regulator [Roseiflexus castenholzii]|uniref:LuxR C-terminal-related transcriptional regulator n=1 Tax=Roseiflexus castenholzii TaxID=120962 RepID=UPI003C79B1F6